jgi:2-polyprenyl-6-methoxyphenol hydroxylase-like FAD-dependent oxidoreductase
VFHVFDRLGVTDAVMAKADCPPALLMRDALTGDIRVTIPTGAAFRERFKHPYIIIQRIDLHHALLDACGRVGEIELVPGAMATRFEDAGDRVVVTTADGRSFSGTALIGADGFRSLVRAKLIGDGEPHPIGYVAHRTIVPMEDVAADVHRREVVLWSGPGFHIVHYPLRHGALFNIVAVFRTSTHGQKGDVASYRAELAETYRDAHPAMHDLLAMMDLERRWQIGDRAPIRHWHRGRVVLLGDAAHPPLQSLAQGACMAIEDGLCLGELIHAAGGDFARAFSRFQAARLLRTARVQLESRTLWDFYHAEGIARDVRNATTAAWDQDHMYRCLAWLYDGLAFEAEMRAS